MNEKNMSLAEVYTASEPKNLFEHDTLSDTYYVSATGDMVSCLDGTRLAANSITVKGGWRLVKRAEPPGQFDPASYDVPEGYEDVEVYYDSNRRAMIPGPGCVISGHFAGVAPSLYPDRFCAYVLWDEAGVFCARMFPAWTARNKNGQRAISHRNPHKYPDVYGDGYTRATLIAVRLKERE